MDPPKVQTLVQIQVGILMPCECDGSTAVFGTARRGSTPWRGAHHNHTSSECAGNARDRAKVEDQVRFLARILFIVLKGGAPWAIATTTTRHFFEAMSKRRKGFPSETHVKRGVRTVHGDKLLEEKLGRNDLCPCGSGQRFKKCCLKKGRF